MTPIFFRLLKNLFCGQFPCSRKCKHRLRECSIYQHSKITKTLKTVKLLLLKTKTTYKTTNNIFDKWYCFFFTLLHTASYLVSRQCKITMNELSKPIQPKLISCCSYQLMQRDTHYKCTLHFFRHGLGTFFLH